MSYIEDKNGFAIYFTREQWSLIYESLKDDMIYYDHILSDSAWEMLNDTVKQIEKHL
jgi:hypothetical protein